MTRMCHHRRRTELCYIAANINADYFPLYLVYLSVHTGDSAIHCTCCLDRTDFQVVHVAAPTEDPNLFMIVSMINKLRLMSSVTL